MTQTAYEASTVNKVADTTDERGLTKSLYHVEMEDYKEIFVIHKEHPKRGGGTKKGFGDVGMIEVTGRELGTDDIRKFYRKYAGKDFSDSQLRSIQDAFDKMAEYYFWGNYEDNAGVFNIDSANYVYTSPENSLREDLTPLYEDIEIPIDKRDDFEKSLARESIENGSPDMNANTGLIHIDLEFQDVPDDVEDTAKKAVTEWRNTEDGW